MTRFDIARFTTGRLCLLASVLLVFVPQVSATVFGTVRGVVHDPQHHPIDQAQVTLQAKDSSFKLSASTTPDGEFHFDAIPLGVYTISVEAAGFATQSQALQLISGSAPILHYLLTVAATKQEVTVTAAPEDLNPDSPRRDIMITQQQISQYAGADASQ